jgi:hypothetical protein
MIATEFELRILIAKTVIWRRGAGTDGIALELVG